MALVGKFVAWENGHAIFGSYKHPRWKPMEVSNSLPINELTVGEAYELQVEGNRLTNFRKAPPRNGGGSSRSSGSSNELTANCIWTNATSVFTAVYGHTKDLDESFRAARRWSELMQSPPSTEAPVQHGGGEPGPDVPW